MNKEFYTKKINNDGTYSITINDGVTEIPDYAFDGDKSLISIIMPDSVKYIGDGVFRNCNNLESIKISDNVINQDDVTNKDNIDEQNNNVDEKTTEEV